MNGFFSKKEFEVRFIKDLEPHEVILDRLAKRKSQEIGFSDRKIEVPLFESTLYRFFMFSVILTLFLFGRVFYLQVVRGDELLAKANKNRYILSKIQAERGVIYDRNLKQLVFNVSSFDLVCQKGNLPKSDENKEKVIGEVSRILGLDYEEVFRKIEESESSDILIADDIEHLDLIVLETKIDELLGFEIQKSSVRGYVDGEDFSHIIGYVGKISSEEWKEESECYSISDCVGRTGIENFYETLLRRNPGKSKVERDALGRVISKEIIEQPESGKSLVLWLDADLQQKIKQELEEKLAEEGSRKAVAVALDPQTGGVLSLVSIPSFDNNLFSKGDRDSIEAIFSDRDAPLFNRTIGGMGYVTGSTIKPIIASAALQEGIVSSKKTINCTGLIEVQHEYDPEIFYRYHDWNIHGFTDIKKAIAESCNVYFYSLGGGNKDFGIKGLGPDRIKEYIGYFGWGKKTGVDLPNEGKGVLPNIDGNWRLGNTYHFSIGQGSFGVTPLQVANAFASIANGGKLMKPKVVKQAVDASKDPLEVLEEKESEVIGEGFIDPENLQIVRQGMRQAVTGVNSPLASAVLLNSLPVTAAAKTGTAETPVDGVYHNWITVFAPYDDPQIVLTLMVEDVEGVRSVVLPVAREVLSWYFSR